MSIEDVVFLQPVEPVSLDSSVHQNLSQAFGPANQMTHADDLFEDFVVCLSSVDSAWSAAEFDRLSNQSEMLVAMSEQLGLVQCAAAARQIACLIAARDDVALAAVVARAVRLGEMSLTSVLEFAYRSN
ncbi:MAG: hypothetical protein KJO42_02765 [Silicimonas sp.]|nr:hypothetical protein [Silicimonas sp.]NND43056.1 hypothetical protein [Silicimonas sp.]RZW12778.1 MAG: hypothetical protein EX266_00025 [Paracoccaceae bacterium]